ncbi:hypothetical protein CORC01_02724 [Colletotrichum orchidophilum]|uniref:Uncharacterized protein n=1 Tax=Colletotrichum orchidophilum TaxID=1209926 RepID=A0A1G4BKL4_9PEZI|nr:uncharacterized protein CORC01_02724 [Colletotrichum orchidophilum]OHF01846.1 hypothetical protein CORC01_02724 [Colletotrichum orchidophilum]
MSAPTLCIAPALPCLALPFSSRTHRHSTFTSSSAHFCPHQGWRPVALLVPPVQTSVSLLLPLPCPSTRPGTHPHHARPAPSLPLPSLYPHFPLLHRFLLQSPEPQFPSYIHPHDSDPLLIRPSKGVEYSRSSQITCAPSSFNPGCKTHMVSTKRLSPPHRPGSLVAARYPLVARALSFSAVLLYLTYPALPQTHFSLTTSVRCALFNNDPRSKISVGLSNRSLSSLAIGNLSSDL